MMARVSGSHHNILDESEDGLICLSVGSVDEDDVGEACFNCWSLIKLKVEHEEGHLHHRVHRCAHCVVNIKKYVVKAYNILLDGLRIVAFVFDDQPDEAVDILHRMSAEMFFHIGVDLQSVLSIEANLR